MRRWEVVTVCTEKEEVEGSVVVVQHSKEKGGK